ncbi:dihydroneopterin triphosphate diphosphatase [Solemya velesiana gill symbiont]|uniref:Dihydroneopterin triphosphate diphosphatase n=1 Tax=Solemya velesiana gill symbiont TaxID=1918948 RepID=A0A1T2KUY8_9GAMM|nr:dihydroneopterin triphosphate diphosphatase [Solemya velesiana gill symbiont]OOZ36688.1 dihydroneopterin triphosphate diphosphatase [Solemya velesiana gill symbiont]
MREIYKRPESVLVVVYPMRGEVLMFRRTRPKHWWQSVTGSLEWGESPGRAAERELFEETGLHGAGHLVDCHHCERFPIIHSWRKRYAPGAHYNREHWFKLQLPGRRIIKLNADEHSELPWLPIPQAARLATSWTNRDAMLSLITAG